MMACPKCPGQMRTYERNGVHVDQCDSCRGIFLDHGELEALSRAEAQWMQQPQPQQYRPQPQYQQGQYQQGPGWGAPGQYHQRGKKGFSRFLFSS
ncbi:zf-TFIIB domain-containing protein [Kutzneria viridogrisea]